MILSFVFYEMQVRKKVIPYLLSSDLQYSKLFSTFVEMLFYSRGTAVLQL